MWAPRADFVAMGAALAALTGEADKIITVGSCCLPEAFYFSHRKGWSGAGVSDPGPWVAQRIEEGARAAALVTIYGTPVAELIASDPLASWLSAHYRESASGKNFAVIDLHAPRDGGDAPASR